MSNAESQRDEYDYDPKPTVPSGRTPGKRVVFAILIFGALFLAFMMLLALRLDPAAERFHNPSPASKKS